MSLEHRYIYFFENIYLVSEERKDDLIETVLPYNLYKDKIKVTTGYIRWSDKGQNNGHSLYIQEREIIARAKAEGYDVVVMFVDKATSAYHKPAQKRKKMKEMKNFILNNPNVTATIFYDESRITRLIEDFSLNIIGPIKAEKPNFKMYSSKIDGEWDENNPFVQVKLTLAHDESVEKSRRTLDYHTSIIQGINPQRPGSRHPFGYSMSTAKDTGISTDENAPIVRFIFYLYSFGYSDKKIADLLNKSDVTPPSLNSTWNDSTVRYILNNPWYIGNLAWFSRTSFTNSKKKPDEEIRLFSNHHEPLIGANLWETSQFFRKHKKYKDRMDSPFILRDLIDCHQCNKKLIQKNMTPAKSKKKYLSYYCTGCKSKISSDILHKSVSNDFSSRWSKEIKQHQHLFSQISTTWKQTLKNKIQEVKGTIEKLRFDLSFLNTDHKHYEILRESFDLQINYNEKELVSFYHTFNQIEELLNDEMIIELINRFKQDILQYSFEEQRSIYLLTIDRITVDFNKDNTTTIEYKLTPYVEIEYLMKSITPKSS